jgi:hemin uptake protein HemP
MLMRTLPLTDNAARDRVVALRATPAAARRIESTRLLDGSRELVIEHQGNEYHLRLTRNDKLILTK